MIENLEERCEHVPHGGGGISSLKQADSQIPDHYILFNTHVKQLEAFEKQIMFSSVKK